MTKRIGVIGSSNIDLVTTIERMPRAGETLTAVSFATGHGGKGANQAVAAAKLGADVVFVTRVGDDAFGADLLKAYRDVGIDTRHALVVPNTATGTATILVEPSGENRILIAAGANATLCPADIDAAIDDLADCALLVIQLEIPLATVHHALDLATARGIDVLLNPAPVHPGLDTARARRVRFLVPNQTELALFSGRPVDTREQAEAAGLSISERGAQTLIVTLGADGALVVEHGRARPVPTIAVVPCDTTGAGDAFIGAFAACWVATGDVMVSSAQGMRYAADSITRPGAQASYADRAAFDAFRKAHP